MIKKLMCDRKPVAEFRDATGDEVDGLEAIFPIFTKDYDESNEFIGTGFFIAKMGLFVTAKHVAFTDGELEYDNFNIVHRYRDGVLSRSVKKLFFHDRADVCVGLLEPLGHKETGEELRNKVVTLTTRIPYSGEKTITYAYPKTVVINSVDRRSIDINQSWYEGKVTKHHPDGRDSVVLPSNCFETSMDIHGGASGGPVFDKYGKAYAINSTGIDGGPTYVSSVYDLLDISVADDVGSSKSVKELAQIGFVSIDP